MKWLRLLVLVLMVAGTASCAAKPTVHHDKTDTLHLVPEGFEGSLIVIYNVEGAPKLKKEKGYTVIPYQDDGTYLTSTEDMEYGAVTDEFYYVDKKDKRTPIERNCAYLFPNSGVTIADRRLLYNAYYLTKTECSDKFYNSGPQNQNDRNIAAKVEGKLKEEGLIQ